MPGEKNPNIFSLQEVFNASGWVPQRRASDYLGEFDARAGNPVLLPDVTRRMLDELQQQQTRQDIISAELRRTQAALAASQANHINFYNEAPVGLLKITPQGQIAETNLKVETLLGMPKESLAGQMLTRFILAKDQECFSVMIKQLVETGGSGACELRLMSRSRKSIWVRMEAATVHGNDYVTLCLAVLIDITKSKKTEEALRRTIQIQSVLREIVENAVRSLSMDELYRAVHRLVGRIFPVKVFHIHLVDAATGEMVVPYRGDEIKSIPKRRPIGKGLTEYIMRLGRAAHLTPDEMNRLHESGECTLENAPELEMFHYLGAPLLDSQEKPFGGISLFFPGKTPSFRPEDIEVLSIIASQVSLAIKRKQMEEKLQYQATIDGLTGIFNRTHFMESAEEAFQRIHRYGGTCSLLMLDIDHFKRVNDNFGHAAGDVALQRIAALCVKAKRSSDLAGRVGGEEFAILLLESGSSEAMRVADRLRQSVQETLLATEKGTPIPLRVSIGVAEHNINEPLSELMARADKAMYRAKVEGRNRVVEAESD